MERYKNAKLLDLGSHTASDKTSKSAGDIEIKDNNGNIFEAVEIKLNIKPTEHIIRVAFDKINKFKISRYYILSGATPDTSEVDAINKAIFEIEQEHGCQVIVNGIFHTLNYYLRLISSPANYLKTYSSLVENDKELKSIHKEKLNELINKYIQ